MTIFNRFNKTKRFGLGLSLLMAATLFVGPGCSTVDANEPAPEGIGGPPPSTEPPPATRVAIGAVYQNAADSRVILINDEGTRFVYWNPATGTFSEGDDIDDLENGLLPLDRVGASAGVTNNTEAYFFDEEGTQFTKYERETSAFDEVATFGDDNGEFGDPGIEDVGAALQLPGSSTIIFFNKVGTQYSAWNAEDETWSPLYSFASDFGGGGAPIASVGAAIYVEQETAFYVFNKNGTRYAIYSANGAFSAAFDVTELGNGSLSFD